MDKKMYDLTAPQKSIWLTEQYYTNSNVNNVCGTAVVSGILDFDVLKKAIIYLLENNDIFRLHFTEENGVLKQYFGENYPYDEIELIELNSVDEIHTLEQKLLSRVFCITEQLYEIKMFKVKNSNTSGCLINIHHILCDAFSAGNICQKALKAYTQLINGETLTIDNQYSYENYLISEKEYYNSQKFIKDKEYWDEMFKTVPNIVTIPSNRKDYSDISYKANRYNYLINKEKMNKILEFCANSKISVFNLFMGVLSIYMNRINNMNDFVIGTPILNRTNFNEKNTLGMFINVAPLRINIDDTSSIFDLFSNIATNSMGLLRHQKYSYQSILENIRKTNPAIPNLYNVILSYQITKTTIESNLSYETNWAFNGTTLNDIEIHLYDVNNTGELNIAYDYKVDKYSEQDIIDVNKRLNYLIDQVLENSDLKIQDLEIATPEERDLILNVFNNTKVDYPSDKTIVELFEEQVELHPDNIAVVFEDEKLTYRELNAKANQLAQFLINKEIQPGSVIGIFLEKSLDVIISILAILKTGSAYLPIDTDYPKDRIHYMIKDSKTQLIISKPEFYKDLENPNIFLDINLSNTIKSTNNITKKTSKHMLAYIMYTSGTTGKPKGVMITHKNIIRLIKNTNYINFSPNDKILQTGSIVFDACTFEIWGALLNGLQLFIITKDTLLDISLLDNYLESHKITILWLTSPLFNQLSEKNPYIFKNVKYLLTGGDVLSPKHINIVKENNTNLTIINGYGPTENTTFSCCYPIHDFFDTSIPIGKPIANSTCYIVSSNGKLQPPNVPGELWVGGDGVGLGYLNKNNLTQEKFIKNPFAEGMLYKTGDLTKWNSDGTISFLGRIDNQVKIRGFRIELSGIDTTILKYSSIENCTTQIIENDNKKIIVAYITSKRHINISKLRTFIAKRLPTYMIPNYFMQIDNIPLNINGKINRKELPIPAFYNNNRKKIISARNKTDTLLINIISDILKNKNISIYDNIFDLGLDSLSAMNLSSKLLNTNKFHITVKDIFEHPIIADLSDYIENNTSILSKNIITTAQSLHYNSSRAQKRIYYTSNMNPDLCVYNISGGIEFFLKLDFDKITKTFNILVNRHESFRTYFEIIDGELYQKILPELHLKLNYKNISHTEVDKYFALFNTKFDLSKAPLLKAEVLYLDNNHTMLLISMHHIISDGTSMQILLQEFCKLYNDEILSPNKFTYKDFINYEQYFSGSEKYSENKEFWLREFENEIPTLNLPTTFTRPSIFSYKGAKITKVLNENLSKAILQVCKDLQVTPYMFLLTTYFILLYKYTNQENITIGTPIANRNTFEFSNIIGMFVNTIAIRKTIHSNKSFLQFLQEVKEKCLNCFTYQDFPFDELVKELNLSRDVSRNPLFDTMFVYQNNTFKNLMLNNKKTKYYLPDTNISKFDLSLEITPQNNNFILSLEYCTDLFSDNFINNFSNHYENLLHNIITNLNTKLCNLEILSSKEKNMLLYDFNDTKVNYDKENYIYKMIDEQSIIHPDYTAITFKNKKLNYKELYEKTNSLANVLNSNGIGKNSTIAIMLPRSLELLIAILATLKTGAAYIPIDPAFPKSRIDYMLLNSNASLILTLDNNENLGTPNLDVSLAHEELYTCTELNFAPPTQSSDPAYIIYTSGSTGNPKGVIIPHKAITNLALCMNGEVDYLKNNYGNMAMASLTTVSFDIFVFETLISLQKGLNVVVATENEQVMPTLLNTLIEKNNIKAFQTTPSKMEIILNNKKLIPNLKNIKYITLVGEPLTNNLKQAMRDAGDIVIYNAYGPTETTVFSTYTDVTHYKNVTIGKPMYNTQIYILDKDNNICPIGVPGELCICGDGVGIGYKNIGPNVKNNFTISPISKRPMYRTGDLAKYLPNGELMYLGRIDNQIKIRGLRIELEEIENKILEFPNINKTVILAQTDNNNRTYLVAYLTITDKISINKLRQHLRKYLPKYMIPSYFEILNEFPYTPNGKVDKKLLPLPNIQKNNQDFVPARNELDKKILNVFEKLLNLSPLGITDNFFELGGDSLLAINLQIELMQFTSGISYADIFLNPTAQELADKINSSTDVIESLTSTIDLLNNNTYIQNYTKSPTIIKQIHNNNILLTGATGYLGSHVLKEFLENETGNVYCLIRPEKGLSIQNKLINKLHFYFDNKFDHLVNQRIFIISGDISNKNLGLSTENYNEVITNVSTIINCAAKVSHFGKYNLYKKINVDGVQNLINFCKKHAKTLYHISTTSVSGEELEIEDTLNISTHIYKENNFFINQKLNNVYVKSKFEAEKLIISELKNGLDAYIFRIGNLMGRYSDGKFQQNIEENAYINRLLSFIRIRNIPKYFLEHTLEFTPVDCCANAIVKLICNRSEHNRIYHLLNNNRILIKDLLNIFEQIYFKIHAVSNNEFQTRIEAILNTNNSLGYLNGIISDFDKNKNLNYIQKIKVSSEFSDNYLHQLDFKWPVINSEYLSKFFNYLNNLYKF